MSVSVIIPVYNAERYVEQAVRSALEQPETGEVLLIEDASPDGALAVCERLAAEHERVRLLRHPNGENRGAAESRNVGLRAARCDLVAFLDADDYYLSGRFERAVAMLAADPELDGVYEAVGVHFESEEMRQWWMGRTGSALKAPERPCPPEQLFEALITGSHGGEFHTNGVTVRRRLFGQCGEFEPSLRMSQDSLMWRRMAAVGRLAAGRLDEPVANYRLHGENRVVTASAIHPQYRQQMFWLLLRWCERRGMPRDLCGLVVDAMLWHRRLHPPNEGTFVRRKLRDVTYYGRLLMYSPAARSRRAVYSSMGRAFGWNRVAALARGLSGPARQRSQTGT